jgi:demethylmenaquinone methyltransferase/2-methoxy-6-polyprenyl-1,4-benzoquinol methylase
VVLGDINGAMLRVGRDRMTDRGNVRGLRYVQMQRREAAVPRRELRPGHHRLRPAQRHRQGRRAARDAPRAQGRRPGAVLEFSEVQADWFKPIYDFHSFKVLPKLGKLFAQDARSYQYLAESIRKHPPQEQLKAMMEAAGFARCGYKNLNAGIVAIHTGYKV